MKDIRKQFPIYDNIPNLVYLDSGATALKPKCVLDKMNEYYSSYGVNIHRGVYSLSYQATDEYDKAREIVAKFINSEFKEVVFTKNVSDALNKICLMLEKHIYENDEVISSELEHHSSVLPWMKACERTKAKLKYIPLNEEGRITVENFKKVLTDKTLITLQNTSIDDIYEILHYARDIKKKQTVGEKIKPP